MTERLGPPVTMPEAGRGAAFADLDNDGDIDVVVNNVHDAPDLYRLDLREPRSWLDGAAGRHAVEPQRHRRARARSPAGSVTQVQEVRGGGSYYSQNDLRPLSVWASAAKVERLEVRWPNGLEEMWTDLEVESDPDAEGRHAAGRSPAEAGAMVIASRLRVGRGAACSPLLLRPPDRIPLPVRTGRGARLIDAGEAADRDGEARDRSADADAARQAQSLTCSASPTITPTIRRRRSTCSHRSSTDCRRSRSSAGKRTRSSGSVASWSGRFAEAIPRLEATRRWAPDNLELAYVLGQAYVQTQQPDERTATFASDLRVAPDSAAAHLIAAQLMIRLEFEAQAEAELTKALEKDPTLPQANFLLGQIALFRGRLAEAIALTERELALNPGQRHGALAARRRATCGRRSGTRRSPRCRNRSG